MKRPVQESPATSGMELANWYWKGVRQFVWERFGVELSRSSCLNWLHRLGFSFKRPKKRLVKANESMREAFVAEYAALREEARETGARILFADEAHFTAEEAVSWAIATAATHVGSPNQYSDIQYWETHNGYSSGVNEVSTRRLFLPTHSSKAPCITASKCIPSNRTRRSTTLGQPSAPYTVTGGGKLDHMGE